MPRIQLTSSTDCDDDGGSRYVKQFDGEIFEYEEDEEDFDEGSELKIGSLKAFLFLRDRALDESASCF